MAPKQSEIMGDEIKLIVMRDQSPGNEEGIKPMHTTFSISDGLSIVSRVTNEHVAL